MEPNTIPAPIYIRAKSDHGEENQHSFIEKQIAGSYFEAVETIWDTNSGIGGSSRSGLVQLFEVLNSRPRIQNVIVDRPSRLSRLKNEVRQIVEHLGSMGVQLHYAEEGLGSKYFAAELARFLRREERLRHGNRIRRSIQLKHTGQ